MAEVAEAWVSLLPSAKNWGTQVDRQVGPELDKAGRSGGSRFSGALGGFLKKSVLGIGAAAGGILGAALFKGFNRLSAIDQAQAKLAGLGNSTKTVSKIMDNALASVQGTAFGLGDAATVAASAVAAGIKPGKQLTRVLKTIADTATIAGASMADTGAIFGSVAARGKLQGDDLMQLQSRGVPVLAFLAKHYGITAAAASAMVTKGKVDFKNFAAAMHEGLGGAALKSGNTFKGALANMQAALGRFGAGLLKGAFPIAKRVFGSITVYLDNLTKKIDPAEKAISAFFTTGAGHGPTVVAMGAIADAASKIGDGFKASITRLDQFKNQLGTLDLNNLDGKKIGGALTTAASTAVSGIGKLGVKIAAGFGKMLRSVDWIGIGIKAGPAVIGLVLGLATGILNGVSDPGLWKDIWKHLPDILLAAAAIAFAPSKIVGPIGRILGRIPFAGKFLEFIVTGINAAGGKVKGVVGDVIGNFFTKLFENSSIANVGTRFVGFFKGIPGAISKFFVDLGETMYLRALSAGDRLAAGSRAAVPALLKFWLSIPGRILRALGSLLRLLSPRGADAVDGLIAGARGKLGGIGKFAGSIPGKIKSGVGNLSKTLYGAGRDIISGLISGITSKLKDLGGKLAGVGSFIKKHKGPPSYDKVMLTPAGQQIMDGLMVGISSKMPALGSTLDDVNSTLRGGLNLPAGVRPSAASVSGSADIAGSRDNWTRSDIEALIAAVEAGREVQVDGRTFAKEVQRATTTGKRL